MKRQVNRENKPNKKTEKLPSNLRKKKKTLLRKNNVLYNS